VLRRRRKEGVLCWINKGEKPWTLKNWLNWIFWRSARIWKRGWSGLHCDKTMALVQTSKGWVKLKLKLKFSGNVFDSLENIILYFLKKQKKKCLRIFLHFYSNFFYNVGVLYFFSESNIAIFLLK
jgi:hypothetical protein